MLVGTQGKGKADGQVGGEATESLMPTNPLLDGKVTCCNLQGIKGTPAESSSVARGTQGRKQSSTGTSRPSSQSPASHWQDTQEREKGKQIPMVRALDGCSWLHFTLGNTGTVAEPRQGRGEPKGSKRALQVVQLFSRRWARNWRHRPKKKLSQARKNLREYNYWSTWVDLNSL